MSWIIKEKLVNISYQVAVSTVWLMCLLLENHKRNSCYLSLKNGANLLLRNWFLSSWKLISSLLGEICYMCIEIYMTANNLNDKCIKLNRLWKKFLNSQQKLELSQPRVTTCKYINDQNLTIHVWLEKTLTWKNYGWKSPGRSMEWNKNQTPKCGIYTWVYNT